MSSRIRQVFLELLVLCIGSSAACAAQGPWRRCAVVSSPEARRSGLGDLVTLALGNVKDLELVERDELAKIENELQLSQLVGAQDAANRLKLGRRLRADCLVLLAGGKDRRLELVIAECLQGARLHRQELAAAEPRQAAQRVKDAVSATRRRFPRGVTRLLGVSDFLLRVTIDESGIPPSGGPVSK